MEARYADDGWGGPGGGPAGTAQTPTGGIAGTKGDGRSWTYVLDTDGFARARGPTAIELAWCGLPVVASRKVMTASVRVVR